MAIETPTAMPDSINAGDSFKVKLSYAEFLASAGWSLTLVIINSDKKIELNSVADVDDHVLSAAPTVTADWPPGLYEFRIFAGDGTDRYQVAHGRIDVLPDLTQLDNFDHRSHVKKVLDALEAMLEGKASQDQSSLTIEGKSLSRYTPEELISWKTHYDTLYRQELDAEAVANGKTRRGVIRTRFIT